MAQASRGAFTVRAVSFTAHRGAARTTGRLAESFKAPVLKVRILTHVSFAMCRGFFVSARLSPLRALAARRGPMDAFAEQKGDPDSRASGMRGESGPPANNV
jgi:hypothetical protein